MSETMNAMNKTLRYKNGVKFGVLVAITYCLLVGFIKVVYRTGLRSWKIFKIIATRLMK